MAAQNWEDILHLLTGWSLVARSDVTDVTGDSGMPWINYKFQRGGWKFDDDSDYMAWIEPQNPNKGFHFEFYTNSDAVRKCRVDITYLDNPSFHRYWGDSDGVLASLLTYHSSEKGDIKARGDGAPTNDGVKLSTFRELSRSFDAAGDFFYQQTEVLKDWKLRLGSEQASWKGNAAGAFWLLVDDLHKKYENYLSQLRPKGFQAQHQSPSTQEYSTTLHGDDLLGAERSLFKAYHDLYKIFGDFYWQRGKPIAVTLPDGSSAQQQIPADPLDVLNQVFVEIGRWIIDHNARLVESNPQSLWHAKIKSGFSENIAWGGLTDTSTWHAATLEAVKRWTTNIETNLDAPSKQVLETLQKEWSRVLDASWNPAFSFTDTSSSLTSDVQSESSDSASNSLNDSLKKLGDGLKNVDGGLKSFGDGVSDGLNNLSGGLNNIGGGLGNEQPKISGNGAFSNFSTGNDSPFNDLPNALGGGNGQSTNIPNISGNGGFSSDVPGLNTPGDGGSSAFGSGLPISNIDGSTTYRTGSGSMTSYPNGSKVTRNADGSITSTFSDGSSRTIAPDGAVTTVDAQGHSTTSHLGVGESLSNPDGTSITRNADGSLTQTAADGTKTTMFDNGTTQVTTPGGETQLTSSDGSVSHVNGDGSLTTDGLDGSKVTVHPNGDVTTVDAQGHSTTTHLDAGKSVTTPDGSTVTVDGKGNIVTHNPDGSTTTLHQDGTITTTQATPDSTGVKSGAGYLGSSNIDIPTFSGGGQVHYTPNGTAITSHPGGVTEYKHTDGSGLVTTSDGRFQSIPSPQAAAAAEANKIAAEAAGGGAGSGVGLGIGSAAQAGVGSTDSQSAMGLLSPMMMMAGMNRMGGQQGGQGGGDRERNLYDGNDMDGAVIHNGVSPFAARATPDDPEEWEEEETDSDELLGPRRPSTESGYGPAVGSRQSADSAAWSGKDKDVWGTEEGGLPASIGH